MAITRGAKKAHRTSLRKAEFNMRRKLTISKNIKSLKRFAAAGNKKGAENMMREVQKALDKAVKSNTLKKNSASRKKSRLSKLVKGISK